MEEETLVILFPQSYGDEKTMEEKSFQIEQY